MKAGRWWPCGPLVWLCFSLMGRNAASCQSVRYAGMASGWAGLIPERGDDSYAGVRYVPELSVGILLSNGWKVDGEAAVNAYATASLAGWHTLDGKAEVYRCWVRLSRPQWEVRAGLQKLNFGSATLLRPLMWFERVDPRDPLQLAEGVTGLLGRYYSLRNVTIWTWLLYGNKEPKGWEVVPTSAAVPEFGGRVQVPVPAGEIALTVHRRVIDLSGTAPPAVASAPRTAAEQRLGLDGKWDLGVALWVELALLKRELRTPSMRYQKMVNVGADYTLGLGSGLHLLGETLWMGGADGFFASGDQRTFAAGTASYPVSITSMVSAIVFYDWRNRRWYRFASWRRTLDRWQWYFLAFWNPEVAQIYGATSGAPQFSGKGAQLLVVLNH